LTGNGTRTSETKKKGKKKKEAVVTEQHEDASNNEDGELIGLRRSARKGLGKGGVADQLTKIGDQIEYRKRSTPAIVDKTIFEDSDVLTELYTSEEEKVT
jgi:hypothetical protein